MVSWSSCALLRPCEYCGIWQGFLASGSKCRSWTHPRSVLGWDLDVHLRSFPPTCPFHSFHGIKCRNIGQKGASVQYILARPPVQIISEQNLGEVCSLYQLLRHRHINHIHIYIYFFFSLKCLERTPLFPADPIWHLLFLFTPPAWHRIFCHCFCYRAAKSTFPFHLIYLSPGHLPLYLWPSLFWAFLKNHLLKLFSLPLCSHFTPHFE